MKAETLKRLDRFQAGSMPELDRLLAERGRLLEAARALESVVSQHHIAEDETVTGCGLCKIIISARDAIAFAEADESAK
jgi:hypothetical protein